jgi:inhibitor of cysteine peptidase
VRADGKADNSNARGLSIAGVVALLLSFGMLLPGCAEHPGKLRAQMLRIDESYSGRTVKLVTGDALEISLAENPTTGYRWHYLDAAAESSPPTCHLVKESYEPDSTGVVGAGGIHHWQFRAAEPGVCAIDLDYRRSWEKGASSGRTFRIRVEVRKGVQDKDTSRPSE